MNDEIGSNFLGTDRYPNAKSRGSNNIYIGIQTSKSTH